MDWISRACRHYVRAMYESGASGRCNAHVRTYCEGKIPGGSSRRSFSQGRVLSQAFGHPFVTRLAFRKSIACYNLHGV
eukprot:11596956-Heterocapsa_arctica.AAC.1